MIEAPEYPLYTAEHILSLLKWVLMLSVFKPFTLS